MCLLSAGLTNAENHIKMSRRKGNHSVTCFILFYFIFDLERSMAWLLIKELVGASEQKPNRSWARRPCRAPLDSSSGPRELRRGP